MSTGLKANSDGSAAIQVGGTDVITLTSGGAATFVTSPTTVQAGTAAAPSITFSGDTNTGIYSPGADTIAFTEGGVESMRIDSSGNLGLGVTPSAWRSIQKSLDIGVASSVTGFTALPYLRSYANAYINSGGSAIYKINGEAGAYTIDGNVHAWLTAPSGTAGNAISFTQVMAVEGGKSLALQGATSQSGTGITFPATQSASTNANTLDDYEEGTWTPVGSTGFPAGGQPSSINATYTRVGNMVSVRAQFVGYNDGTSLLISGLPFSASNDCAASIANSTPNTFSYERISGTGFQCTINATNATNRTWVLAATYQAA